MARVRITQENMDNSRIIPPGKYPIECVSITEETSGKDGSLYYEYYFRIINGPYAGVKLRDMVSEKFESAGYLMWECLGAKIAPGAELDPLSFKGKRCVGVVKRGEYNGRPQNKLVDYQKLEGPAAEATTAVKAE
jgi:hypothetical protein